MKKLHEHTPAEQVALPYPALCELRKAAYSDAIGAMTVPDEIKNFALVMTERAGATIQVWRVRLPWLEALMVVRYGEEPGHWPEAFSAEDIQRALRWMAGDTPASVVWANQHPNL
ncbi:MAG: hypothetical protein NUV51_05110, partial [Sulfuricaulis sp.]|nr:hypothetical protein [Sulfuricaulis sp.]